MMHCLMLIFVTIYYVWDNCDAGVAGDKLFWEYECEWRSPLSDEFSAVVINEGQAVVIAVTALLLMPLMVASASKFDWDKVLEG